MDIKKIDQVQAHQIALEAMNNAGWKVTQFSGYWSIWSCDDVDYAIAINKEHECGDHFAVYVSINPGDESWWEYTDNLDVEELTEIILNITDDIDFVEMDRRNRKGFKEALDAINCGMLDISDLEPYVTTIKYALSEMIKFSQK